MYISYQQFYFLAYYKLRQLKKCHILLEHRAATEGSRNSSVEIATWLRAGEVSKRGSIPGRGQRIFLWSKTSRWFWGPPRLSFGEYRWPFPRKNSRSAKLVLRLRMSAATAPLLHKPPWRAQGQIYLNPLNAELNPIYHLLALLGGATIVVVSRLRVNGQSRSWE